MKYEQLLLPMADLELKDACVSYEHYSQLSL